MMYTINWYPVEELLPVVYFESIVTIRDGHVTHAFYSDRDNDGDFQFRTFDGDVIERVVAWSPMPIPYGTKLDI